MTHLSLALNELIARKPYGFSKKVARKIGVSEAYLSRLRSGERKGISPEILFRLVRFAGDNSAERAELIAAHLKDESCGYWPTYIKIEVSNVKFKR